MASRYLGDDFDIHAGGTDLIFPHHENEIAQSESATGKTFARYWLHNGMVNLDGAKMAKSTGNVVDLKAALERFGGMPLRLLFLRAHYRAPIEYSEELVEEAAEAYRRIERLLERAPQTDAEPDPKVLADFSGFMNDDFATPGAVGVLFEAVRDANRLLDDGADTGPVVAAIHEILGVLGLDAAGSTSSDHEDVDVDGLVALSNELGVQPSDGPTAMVDSLLALRGEARAAKDFATSDAIRDRLAELGINVEDTADGARWIRG